MSNDPPIDRRPITTRDRSWARRTASWLVRRKVSPNAISVSSVVFGGAAALAMVATVSLGGAERRLAWVAAAALVQLRLLANMLDGMVAVESGEASPIGELFNEVPDRFTDVAALVALGFVAGSSVYLGFSAAVLAVFVSYVRAVGGSAGAGQVFEGWMAKPQRMFLVTVLCLFMALSPTSWQEPFGSSSLGWPAAVLAVICIGCVLTAGTRLRAIARRLEARS